jgi:MFS transporter, SHS family, lactate transporter
VEAIRLFKSLNHDQRRTFVACFLGWALDAFDFFLLTFVLVPVAHEFGRTIPEVAFGITLTLMMRPLGAFIFGLLGDKFGRRVPLMGDIIFYSATRGLFSGILQQGYATGYLLAAIVYWIVFPLFGWRGLFVAGALPALLVLYIRARVPESPVWQRNKKRRQHLPPNIRGFIRQHGTLFIHVVLLMTAFNYMSHGTQDLYATFLERQRGFGVSEK